MDRIVVTGGVPLRGTIEISGAKNAALPLLATALLTDEPVSLESVPDLADTASMLRLLQVLGVEARHLAGAPGRVTLHCPEVMSTTAPYDLVRKMRASVLVLGPLVARCGKASVSLPAAAPSARGRSTCISPASRPWAPRSSSTAAMSMPRPPRG